MPFTAALSQHPLPTHAVGEVVGQVLDRLGEGPDLAVLFVGATHTGAMEDIAAAVRDALRPRALVGCSASTVVGGRREVEGGPAVALWAGRLGMGRPLRLTADVAAEPMGFRGFPPAAEVPDDAAAVLLLADPFTFPADRFLDHLRDRVGVDLAVVGGLASAARGAGGNRLVRDGTVYADGAVGVVLGGVDLETVVSQGCRPVGDPMVVTSSEQQIIFELAGRPALERLQQLVAGLDPADLQRAQQGLHLGRVIDERKPTFGRGDFLIRNVLVADRETGAVAVGDRIEVGATVQFQVRDASSADEDLRQLLGPCAADGALVFTCNGRGTNLFDVPDHDAEVVSGALREAPLAGMSCAGEIGPVGGQNFLHGFTASVVLFRDRQPPPGTGPGG
ncbi:MAG: FIST signal transduction protein [Acidimicrobiales bacterium]